MALTEKAVIELVRARLGIVDNSRDIAILWSIPHALSRLGRKIAADPSRRSMLMTPSSTAIDLDGSSSIDLAVYNQSAPAPVLIEYLKYGLIYYNFAAQQPLVPATLDIFNEAAANDMFGGDYHYYFLDGTVLKVFPSVVGLGTPRIQVAVPFLPKLSHIAALPELHELLIDKVLELLPEYNNADVAEDDAK